MTQSNPNYPVDPLAAERAAAQGRAAADLNLADQLGGGGPGATPHRPADDAEQVYFDGSPMLRGEIGSGVLWIVGGFLLIAAPIIWRFFLSEANTWWPWYLVVGFVAAGIVLILVPVIRAKTIRYRISNYRIDYERGLFSKAIDSMELWHVDDLKYHQSFLARLFGVGTITILSNDKTTPELSLRGLPNPRPLFDSLKQRIIAVKRQRGVIKMDVG